MFPVLHHSSATTGPRHLRPLWLTSYYVTSNLLVHSPHLGIIVMGGVFGFNKDDVDNIMVQEVSTKGSQQYCEQGHLEW